MPQDKDELLQVLITKYAQMYMKLAYAIGVPYDDVEDIVMEAFWSFYRADYGGKLESEKAIKVMLARIVENKCIDYFRKEKRSIKPNEDEDVSELEYVADLSTYDPLQSVISRESCGQIFEVLDHDKRMNDCLPPILFSAIFKLLKVLPDTELDAC